MVLNDIDRISGHISCLQRIPKFESVVGDGGVAHQIQPILLCGNGFADFGILSNGAVDRNVIVDEVLEPLEEDLWDVVIVASSQFSSPSLFVDLIVDGDSAFTEVDEFIVRH